MSRLGRPREEGLEGRVLEYVQRRPWPIGIVDVRTTALDLRLNRQTAKTVLLELALERRIMAQKLSGRWFFAGLPDV